MQTFALKPLFRTIATNAYISKYLQNSVRTRAGFTPSADAEKTRIYAPAPKAMAQRASKKPLSSRSCALAKPGMLEQLTVASGIDEK
jgi:hypothetical protein